MNTLRFEPSTHTYFLNNQIVPSVTQILKATGHIKEQFYHGDGPRDLGTRVHEATQVWDCLEVSTSEEDVIPYLEKWKEWLKTNQAKVRRIEFPVYHVGLGYAGTCDRIIEIFGHEYVTDLKTGGKASWHPLQIAAYALALEDMSGERYDAGCIVRLKGKKALADIWRDNSTKNFEALDPYKQEWKEIVKQYKELQHA